ncbi:hypothetical protein PIB30_077233 [Stylosanthes scabra]|uniref:Putative plant transposon protein domain-containing protein n=1 Tax=Stylosanthes scabra TaxID=79078 RepID=A0ABU6YR34_9FABA|nr:hypothetical protein [Stylosanthes scabra]
MREQIALRGWRKLAAPTTEISKILIHEFYANTIITEEEREEHGGHPYMSFVRGVPVNFSPENIRRVMRFKAKVEGARTDFETRKAHDQQLDNVLADLCMPGATWKLSTGQQKVSTQLRRSEIPVIRAILIHCIMKGEDDAGVPLKEFRKTKKISAETPITARRMESTRLPRNPQHQPQDNEDEDQPMPQAEEGHEEEQGEEHDYQHHQPEYDHQPEFQHEPQFQQPPLYEMPTYTDQHEKDLHSIEEQLQNIMPMFYGLLKSDLPPSGTAPPPPKSKDPRDAPN